MFTVDDILYYVGYWIALDQIGFYTALAFLTAKKGAEQL